MSDVKFPLCSALGLKINFMVGTMPWPWVSAESLERVLSKGMRVCGVVDDAEPRIKYSFTDYATKDDTHTALLIDIKPIAKPERRRELSESQVREACRDYANRVTHQTFEDVINRLFGDTNKEGGR